jgi:hypothetical protein
VNKQQIPFVCSKQKTKMENFRLFAANGKENFCLFDTNRNGELKFGFLGWQTINGN